MIVNKLSDIVKPNNNFKNAINLYLDINKSDKVDSYIPTKSSLNILQKYLSAVQDKKNQSTILIGSYGKGKSHLLLVLLSVLSMERNGENDKTIQNLMQKIAKIDFELSVTVENAWNAKPLLPVIIMGGQDDLKQSFMVALNDALKRANLMDIMPDTFFSHALEVIKKWKVDYPETYDRYENLLSQKNILPKDMEVGLKQCNAEKLTVFKTIYPELTSGSVFNPLAGGNVLSMYRGVSDKLKEDGKYKGIYIVFDEFSKYIEGQDKQSAGNNMKLLQDMCELANDAKDIYLTMVAHKSIKEYGKYLSDATINAFTGIEGRIEEVLFVTSSKNNYELVQNAIQTDEERLREIPHSEKYFSDEVIDKYYKIVAFRTGFTREDFEKIVVKGCYPLSPVTAYALLNISEKVAQNERTLFTFVSKEEPYSMAQYVKEHSKSLEWVIKPDLIYDYFKNIFKKEINNEFIHTEWLNADYAISKADSNEKKRILKILAVINIINKMDELPATEEMLVVASGLADASDVISGLVSDKLIYKKGANNCYTFKTRAGAELKNEIKRRREKKGDKINYTAVFEQICDKQYVLPKRYNYDYSMTRYFKYEFMDVTDFLQFEDPKVFFDKYQDGKVIALYNVNDEDYMEVLEEKIRDFNVENLIIVYSALRFEMLKQARDFEIVQELVNDIDFVRENEVLLKELFILQDDIETEISSYLKEAFDNTSNRTIAYFNQEWFFDKESSIDRVVDIVCENCYPATMVVNNELINRQQLSAPIKKARRIIVDSVFSKKADDVFRVGTSAEATIYRAVMINSGLISENRNARVNGLLDIFSQYLDNCVENKNSLANLVSIYSDRPYGMRSGILPIVLAYAMSQRKEDIIVYYGNMEISLNADTIINMCEHPNEYSLFISRENAEKERYLADLANLFGFDEEANLNENRIANILVCMQRWYRALPQNAKNIRNASEYIQDERVIKILPRYKVLMQKVEINAYEVLFNTLPELCSETKDYAETIKTLQHIKNLLNGYMQWLLDTAIDETILVFDKKKKEDLSHTLHNWYEKQSQLAKNGLHNSAVTGLMSFIASFNTYDEYEIIKKVIKLVTEIYVDAWNDDTLPFYLSRLNEIKEEIESITDEVVEGQCKLTFTNKNGVVIEKFYEMVDESTGAIFRNIIEDTLEDFSDLSVNAKVAILLEAIENVMKRGE